MTGKKPKKKALIRAYKSKDTIEYIITPPRGYRVANASPRWDGKQYVGHVSLIKKES